MQNTTTQAKSTYQINSHALQLKQCQTISTPDNQNTRPIKHSYAGEEAFFDKKCEQCVCLLFVLICIKNNVKHFYPDNPPGSHKHAHCFIKANDQEQILLSM